MLQRLNDYYIQHITTLDFENTMDDIEKSIWWEKVAAIQDNPFAYSVKYNEIRTAQVKNFPYLVHFKVEEPLGII